MVDNRLADDLTKRLPSCDRCEGDAGLHVYPRDDTATTTAALFYTHDSALLEMTDTIAQVKPGFHGVHNVRWCYAVTITFLPANCSYMEIQHVSHILPLLLVKPSNSFDSPSACTSSTFKETPPLSSTFT